jgi:hypothetical protein
MAIGGVNVGQELLNVPMGDMIRSMALAIAQAQWELDKSSVTVTELMSGQRLLRDLDTGKLLDKQGKPTGETSEPTIIDSRVYFGYTYVSLDVDAQGKIDGQEPTEAQKRAIKDATGKEVTALASNDKENLKKGIRVPQKLSMIELGFVPTFYQFVETIIEVKIDIHIHGSTDDTRSSTASASTQASTYGNSGYWWWYNQGAHTTNVTTSQVNASYASKYSHDVTGTSFLRTKMVPVPPPPILEERIRELMEIERAYLLGNPEKAKERVR